MATNEKDRPENWYEITYLKHLENSWKNYKKTVTADSQQQKIALLNADVMAITQYFIENLSKDNRLSLGRDILIKLETINAEIKKQSLDKKLNRDSLDIALGEYLECLKFYNLPYEAGYKLAAYISGKESITVRKAHEKYRNAFDMKRKSFDIIAQVKMGPYLPIVKKLLLKNQNVDLSIHPEAKNAYKKSKTLYLSS